MDSISIGKRSTAFCTVLSKMCAEHPIPKICGWILSFSLAYRLLTPLLAAPPKLVFVLSAQIATIFDSRLNLFNVYKTESLRISDVSPGID